MADISERKLAQREFDTIVSPMEMDLLAMFSHTRDLVLKKIAEGGEKGWDEDRLIKEISKLTGVQQ
ncbi:hypothetical protein KAR91_74350 [Candidatus Pacearchaeota archaeon]|nr:hypothetical protein [Candidatus Pacearchaeota archaeon]